jgi:membrane-anchored glycerophosphoryl diester phosphodiesterase (GDPDase)
MRSGVAFFVLLVLLSLTSLEIKNINSIVLIMSIKLVKQENEFGCGVACVAALLGITYQQALKLFDDGYLKAKTKGFLCKEICLVLNKLGENYKYKYVKSRLKRKIYQSATIVFIKKSKKYPANHYLLRTENRWLDPWMNLSKDKNIKNAKAGLRKRLPGRAIYYLQE